MLFYFEKHSAYYTAFAVNVNSEAVVRLGPVFLENCPQAFAAEIKGLGILCR
jgi:hypothetical protein